MKWIAIPQTTCTSAKIILQEIYGFDFYNCFDFLTFSMFSLFTLSFLHRCSPGFTIGPIVFSFFTLVLSPAFTLQLFLLLWEQQCFTLTIQPLTAGNMTHRDWKFPFSRAVLTCFSLPDNFSRTLVHHLKLNLDKAVLLFSFWKTMYNTSFSINTDSTAVS